MKMLACGLVANACDEKNKIEENTTIKCLSWFVKAIQDLFEFEYVKQLLWVHIDEDGWM
jgi:tRNA (Thr-GGU) A37 N-methylase